MTLPIIDRRSFLVIRTDGSEETVTLEKGSLLLPHVRAALGFDTLDFVYIGNPNSDLIMAVDDNGWEFDVVEHGAHHHEHVPTKAKKPVNAKATAYYHAICVPGTTHQIVGDVAIFHDGDR
jgi:hypothetical protein